MYEEHRSVRTPKDCQGTIWRYFKAARFLDLLESEHLHFARLDQYGDPFEGVLPDGTVPLESDRFRHAPIRPGDRLTDWQNFMLWANRTGKFCSFANCWYSSDHESEGMWHRYGDGGVAVRSTFSRLRDSLWCEPEPVHLGEMYYLDFATKQPPTYRNILVLPYLKRREYEHEREVRAVVVKHPEGWKADAEIPAMHPTAIKVAVDLDKLIDVVVVAPGSPETLRNEIRAALSSRHPNKEVRSSVLDERPTWI